MAAITDKRKRKLRKKHCVVLNYWLLLNAMYIVLSICSPTTQSNVNLFAYELENHLVMLTPSSDSTTKNTKILALIAFHHSKVRLHWLLIKLLKFFRCLIFLLIFVLA